MKRIFLLLCMLLCVDFGIAQNTAGRSESVVTILGESFYVHTVQAGETMYGLEKTYNVTEDEIIRNNPQAEGGLKAGHVLKIPVKGEVDKRGEEIEMTARQKRRVFTTHTVNQGETGYSISKRYGVPLNTLIEDNKGLDPSKLRLGQVLNIRRESIGSTTPEQAEEQIRSYSEALNSLSENFVHHVVQPKETLYSLGRRYGVPEDELRRNNAELLKDGLKAGTVIRIPVKQQATAVSAAPVEKSGELFPDQPAYTENVQYGDGQNIPVKNIDIQAPVKIAVMLPLRVDGSDNQPFVDFYQGLLMGLDELKPLGVSARVDVFNTGRSEEEVRSLLSSQREIGDADIIIGPVYDETFTPVADFAKGRGIPVVSPLAPVTADNSLLFQIAPAESGKNDKLRAELSGDRNVIVVSAAPNDQAFEQETAGLISGTARSIVYAKDSFSATLERALSKDKENMIIVLAGNENNVEAILARISSVQNNMVARSMGNPVIKVVGSSRWSRFSDNFNKDLFFKLNLMYVTSYHADRSNPKVADFDKKFVASFNSFPNSYSYRGYDIAKLFVCNLKLHGNGFTAYLNDGSIPLLQTPYKFEQTHTGSKYVNTEWALVCYHNDYTVQVK